MNINTSIINIGAINAAVVREDPFPYLIVSDFLRREVLDEVLKDFPKIELPGSIPLHELQCGEAFQRLVEELEGAELRNIIEKKFSIDLEGRPTFITVRGRTRYSRDGHIHTDSKSKLITLLLYFNPDWNAEGGRLRILRNGKNLEDFVEEVSPAVGTCLIFKVTENCWHGHKPFEGERKAIQLNYLADQGALTQHQSRHRITAKLKNLRRWLTRNDSY